MATDLNSVPPNERLAYSIADAAHMIGLGRTKVFELIKAGVLQTVTVGRRRLVPRAALEELIERPQSGETRARARAERERSQS